MSPETYLVVAEIKNDSANNMRLFLEMLGAEVVLSPGHSVELLARPAIIFYPSLSSILRKACRFIPIRNSTRIGM